MNRILKIIAVAILAATHLPAQVNIGSNLQYAWPGAGAGISAPQQLSSYLVMNPYGPRIATSTLTFTITGTTPGACTFNLQGAPDAATWSNLDGGSPISCTATGSETISGSLPNYVRVYLRTFTQGDSTTLATFSYQGSPSSSSYSLPIATPSVLGGVKPDGSTCTVNGTTGVLTCSGSSYTLPQATPSVLGGVKPDGTNCTTTAGVITCAGTYSLPQATPSVLGGVKPDGTTCTTSAGVLTCSGGGSGNYVNITGSITWTGCTSSSGVCTTTGSVASITAANIPGGYNNLIFVLSGVGSTNLALSCQFNGDSGSNYAYQGNQTIGNSSGPVSNVNLTSITTCAYLGTLAGSSELEIPFYAGSSPKITLTKAGLFDSVSSNTNNQSEDQTGVWSGTAAITQVVLTTNTGTVSTGFRISVYGTN